MAEHFNGLTPAELERLALLAEELAEAGQAIGKILRHGYESHHPHGFKPGTNREQLEQELGDVIASIQLLTEARDLDSVRIGKAGAAKRARVGQYLHHQNGANGNG